MEPRPIKVDVRVLAATNPRSRGDGQRDNRFREDLYYRLNVIPIDVLSHRQRRDDIRVLMDYSLRKRSRPRSADAALELRLNAMSPKTLGRAMYASWNRRSSGPCSWRRGTRSRSRICQWISVMEHRQKEPAGFVFLRREYRSRNWRDH